MPRTALSIRKLIRVCSLAAIGSVATTLTALNLAAFDKQSLYFAAIEGTLAVIMLGALYREVRRGGWRAN